MKTLKYLLFLCAISTYSMAGWAQTTYNYTGSTNCPYDDITGTGNCSSKFLGKTIKMRVASIDGTKVTFEISKCDDGSTFSQGSTLYIKESSGDASISQVVCGTIDVFQYPNGSIVGKTTVSFPLWMDHTSGSRQYCGVIVGTTDRYYTNVLTVTASIVKPTVTTEDATFVSQNSARLNGIVNPKGSFTTYWFKWGTSSNALSHITSIQNLNSNSDESVSYTITGLTPATPHYFKLVAKNDGGETEGNIRSFSTVKEWFPPIIVSQFHSDVTERTATLNAVINPNGFKTAYFFYYGTSTATNLTTEARTIDAGTSNVSVSVPINLLASNTPYYYKVVAGSKPDENSDMQYAQSGWQQFTTTATSPYTLQLNSEMGFYETPSGTTKVSTLEIGKTYYFRATIKNTGGTNFTGSFYLKKGLGASYSDYIAFYPQNQTITANGGTLNLSGTFTPSSQENNISLGIYYTDNSNSGQVSGGSYSSTITITTQNTVTPPSGDCTFSDPSSSSSFYTATCFLFKRDIISGYNNGADFKTEENITRSDLAKAAFNGLYLSNNRTVPNIGGIPSDYSPSVYSDVNNITSEIDHRAAKALLYLEYGDGISPFDRNRSSFQYNATIERIDVLKVLLETFDIQPNLTNKNNPFPNGNDAADIARLIANDPAKFGYLRQAADLGIITKGEPFRPCLRGEVFSMLHRIIDGIENNLTGFSNPAPLTNDYFIPLNVTLQNLAFGLGLELGNFNHYTQTSFAIDGVVPLSFSHTYNSYSTELPDEFYGMYDAGQGKVHTYKPLGVGWSHQYHSFITEVETETGDKRLIVHWGGGAVHVYKSNGSRFVPESLGIFDEIDFEGTTIVVKSKSQMEYRFKKHSSVNSGVLELYSVKDRNGNTLNIAYEQDDDGLARIASISDNHRQLTFSYNSGNRISQITDPLGRSVRFAYEFVDIINDYLLTSFTDAKGQQTVYEYDNRSKANRCKLLKKIRLPKGNYIENEYDDNRRLTQSVTGINGIPKTRTKVDVTTTYSNSNPAPYSTVTVFDDSKGTSIPYNYYFDKNNNATKITGNKNMEVTAEYHENGLPKSLKTNNEDIQSILYDGNWNVTQITKRSLDNSDTRTVRMEYNDRNDIVRFTDARGSVTNYDYDNKGNLTTVTAPESSATGISVNTKGLVEEITNPEGIKTEFFYNSYGNLRETTITALNLTSVIDYDDASRIKGVMDFLNRKTKFTYDNNDNPETETDEDGYVTRYEYDANDNMTSIINAKGRRTSLNYDNTTDWLTSVSFEGSTKNFAYNDDGTLKSFTKPDNTPLSYNYDDLGRITSDGVNSYNYDTRHRLATITKDGKTLTFGYDGFNRITSVEYDNTTVSYTYDENGNIRTLTYPGNKTVSYTYDALNRMKTVTDWNNRTITYNYLRDNRLNTVSYPNGMTVRYDYDAAGRQTGKTVKRNNGTVIASYSFVLDKTGNIIEENKTEPYSDFSLPNEVTDYSYTNANRIEKAGSVNFTFDANGNTKTRGNSNYNYDALDKLTSGDGFSFEYDGLGNIRSNGSKRYIIDVSGMGNVIAETNLSGTPTAYYIYGLGLEARILSNGTTEHYVSDYRGSVVAMVDDSNSANITHKYQYDEFGKILQKEESDENVFRYVGKYGVMYANDNLYYMRARFYDPTIGRFLSEDPIWSTNLYPYAGNNPVMGIDPRGKDAQTNAINTWNELVSAFSMIANNITSTISEATELAQKDYYQQMTVNPNNGWATFGYLLCDLWQNPETRDILISFFPGLKLKIIRGVNVSLSIEGEFNIELDEKILTQIFGKTGWLKLRDMRDKFGYNSKEFLKVAGEYIDFLIKLDTHLEKYPK